MEIVCLDKINIIFYILSKSGEKYKETLPNIKVDIKILKYLHLCIIYTSISVPRHV